MDVRLPALNSVVRNPGRRNSIHSVIHILLSNEYAFSKYYVMYFQKGCSTSSAYCPQRWQYIPFSSVPQFLQ